MELMFSTNFVMKSVSFNKYQHCQYYVKVQGVSEWVKVAQSCLTLGGPMDYIVHGILQARILEWVAFPSSTDLPNPGIEPRSPHWRWILYLLSHKGSPGILGWVTYPFSSGSSQPRNRTRVSCIAGRFFTNCAMREAQSRHKLIFRISR